MSHATVMKSGGASRNGSSSRTDVGTCAPSRQAFDLDRGREHQRAAKVELGSASSAQTRKPDKVPGAAPLNPAAGSRN
jgi:hypothetical protein